MDQAEGAVKHLVPNPKSAKAPPCDQCRRRKVKCDTGAPCDRCTQSSLRCTRDIVRKRRGPKKGSGSVIAKLKNENGHTVSRSITGEVAHGLSEPELDIHRQILHRSMSGSSGLSSQFSEGLGPTSDPSTTFLGPTSAPLQSPDAIPMLNDFPPIQYPSPGSNNEYVSISDLAHRIFDSDDQHLYPVFDSMSISNGADAIPPPLRPGLTDALSGQSIFSPHTYDGPELIYRTASEPVLVESRVAALADEVRMSAQLISLCVKQYFRHLYPIMPIIHQATFCRRLEVPEELAVDEKSLVLAMCAITVLHAAPMSDLSLEGKKGLGRQFVSHSLALRHQSDWIENATLTTTIASFFIGVAYFDLKQARSHHFYLREAVGMALEQAVHLESTYEELDKIQAICYRRTFAVLFVSERAYAIFRNKSTSFTTLPILPTDHFDDEDPSIIAGFQCLCRLFTLLDKRFVELWRASAPDEDDTTMQFENISSIQQSLNAMSFGDMSFSDIQKADVLVTHQWLRLIFWQASMRHGLIASSNRDSAFRYDYPIVIAKALCRVMHHLPLNAILVHGLGIFEKMFDVAYTLMDALTIAKIAWAESDELRYLFSCLSSSPNSHHTYVRMLETKMDS